jgi:hypothetical protein
MSICVIYSGTLSPSFHAPISNHSNNFIFLFSHRSKLNFLKTDGHSASLYWCQASLWEQRPNSHFLYLSIEMREFVDMGHPLWRETGSVVYGCCWPSTAQYFTGLIPTGLMTIFYCLNFETSPKLENNGPVYCHVLRVGRVTNNTTRVRIGYRIYSLWRFTAAQITIMVNDLALVASWILLSELHCTDPLTRTPKTSYCWLPCNATVPEWWAYPWNYCGYGYLVTTQYFRQEDSSTFVPSDIPFV